MTDLSKLAAKMTGTTPTSTPPSAGTTKAAPPPPPRAAKQVASPVGDAAKDEAPGDGEDSAVVDAESVDADETQREDTQQSPASVPATTTVKTVSHRSTARAAAQAMAPRVEAGDLVQVRVQPPELGTWINQLLDGACFAYDTRRGDIAGALFVLIRNHIGEFFQVMEEWGKGEPEEFVRRQVWTMLKRAEAERDTGVVDGDIQ
jgi:hypothetical protein